MSPIVSLCLPVATLLFSIIPVCYVMTYTLPCGHANKQSILVVTSFVYSGKCQLLLTITLLETRNFDQTFGDHTQ